jgi:hypothetical protein
MAKRNSVIKTKRAMRARAKTKALKTIANGRSKVAVKKGNLGSLKAGAARAEGIRLFKLAGRPTKEQFIAVYGKNGAKMTWEQRAKTAGLRTAESAARKFQSTLGKA